MDRLRNRTKLILIMLLGFLLLNCCVLFAQSASRKQAMELNEKGLAAIEKKEYQAAIRHFEEAIKVDPDYDVSYANTADLNLIFFNRKDAIENLEKAIELNDEEPSYKVKLAGILIEGEKYNEALKLLEEVSKLDEKEPKFFFYRGQIYFHQGEMEKAKDNLIVHLDMQAAADEDKLRSHMLLGDIFLNLKEWNKAQEHYQIVMNHPDTPDSEKRKIEPKLKTAKSQAGSFITTIVGGVILLVVILILYLFWKFIRKQDDGKTVQNLPSSAKEAGDYKSLSVFAVQHLKLLTKLPRALIYFATREGRPMSLTFCDCQDPDRYDELEVDWEELPAWLNKNAGRPFIYNIEKKEISFMRAFPKSRDKIDSSEPRVGVPFVYQGRLRGIAFMASPKTKELMKLRRTYEKNINMIHKVGTEVATAAETIFNKDINTLDSITPAYNHVYYKEKLSEEIGYCQNKKLPLSLVMFEIDKVTAIEKRFGDERKNYVLKTLVTNLISQMNNKTDYIFRISDYRFAVILSTQDKKKATEKASLLMDAIADTQFTSPIPSVTASMGLVVYPEQGANAKNLDLEAKKALDQAVASGRNKLIMDLSSSELRSTTITSAKDSVRSVSEGSGFLRQRKKADTKTSIPIAPPIDEIKSSAKQETMGAIKVTSMPNEIEPSESSIRDSISISPPEHRQDAKPEKMAGKLKSGRSTFKFRAATRTKPEAPKRQESVEPEVFSEPAPLKDADTPLQPVVEKEAARGLRKVRVNDPKTEKPDDSKSEKPSPFRKAGRDFAPIEPESVSVISEPAPPLEKSSSGLKVNIPPKTSTPPWLKEKAMKKPEDSREMSETSLLRRPPKMREVGSSTSKLPPLPKSLQVKKPMEGLIRRFKSPTQAPGLKRRTANISFRPLRDADAAQSKVSESPSGALTPVEIEKIPSPAAESMPAQGVKPASREIQRSIPTMNVKPQKIVAQPLKKTPKTIERTEPSSSKASPVEEQKTSARSPRSLRLGTAPLPKLEMKSIKTALQTGSLSGTVSLTDTAAAVVRKKQATPAAARDPVTQFFYKSYFEQSIKRLMVRANRNKRPLALIFFKLDKHKELKSKYGQNKLNNVLKDTSSMIGSFLKEGSDVPARYSDEIFVIILPDTSYQIAFNLAEQIRFTVGNLSFKDVPGQVTLSLGIASFPNKGKNPKEVMKNSYDAMVYAIKSGGNRSVIWDEDFQKKRG